MQKHRSQYVDITHDLQFMNQTVHEAPGAVE